MCPAATIATLLNHVLGSVVAPCVVESVAHVEVEEAPKAVIDKKKKKKSKALTESIEVRVRDDAPSSAAVPECPNAGGDKEKCIQQLHSLARSRFCMPTFALMFPQPSPTSVPVSVPASDATEATAADVSTPVAASTPSAPAVATAVSIEVSEPATQPFLSDRISRITLLRRICQVSRHYT